MKNLRIYGKKPFKVAVIHGGPGAPGEMAPVARALAFDRGVLEPLQAAFSVDGQVEELHSVLVRFADNPVVLAGYSWGAWLSIILAAQYPELAAKLILISSGPLEERYAENIMNTRLGRLDAAHRAEALHIMNRMDSPAQDKDDLLGRFGRLMSMADSYDTLPDAEGMPVCSSEINARVWNQAVELRKSGRLLQYAAMVRCPVAAIHGSHDPHPVDGVKIPLSKAIGEFRCIVLEKCGHTPWRERQAQERFFKVLKKELSGL